MRVMLDKDNEDDFIEIILDSKDISDINEGLGITQVFPDLFERKKNFNLFIRKVNNKEEK